jgi:iron complex transport system substrate-binding protein
MIRVLLALTLAAAPPALARTVTDSAGRTVELLDQVDPVFAAGPPASVLVYVMTPTRPSRSTPGSS